MARLLFRDSQGREGTVELSPSETVYVGRGLHARSAPTTKGWCRAVTRSSGSRTAGS